MRAPSAAVAISLLACSGAALATTGKETSTKAGRSSGPSSSGASQPSAGETRPEGRDKVTPGAGDGKVKSWEIGTSWELHHLFVQSDLAGAGINRNLNYFDLYGRYDITPNDRLMLRFGLYQRFIADEGETGVRLDDTILSYTHYFHLPADFVLRGLVWVTAPTSFYSQKASIITVPRLSLGVERTFVKYIDLDARASGDYYVVRFASTEGGAANPRAHLGLAAGATFTMPFHTPLQLGLSVYSGYTWFYEVGGPPPSSVAALGAIEEPRQKMDQTYGGEIYARYAFPSLRGFKSDLTLAVANGDPTLGYASALHDGTRHLYGLWRQNAEIYGTLAARY